MTPRISDSRWPPRRPGASVESTLSQYPSYLSAPTPVASRRIDRLLVSVALAFGVSLLGQLLVGSLLVFYTELSFPTLEPVLVVVGLLGCWSQLLRLSVDRALFLAFWGQVSAVVADLPFRHLALPVGLGTGTAAAIGVMYLLARFRGRPA